VSGGNAANGPTCVMRSPSITSAWSLRGALSLPLNNWPHSNIVFTDLLLVSQLGRPPWAKCSRFLEFDSIVNLLKCRQSSIDFLPWLG
jgi:hypothetical protein